MHAVRQWGSADIVSQKQHAHAFQRNRNPVCGAEATQPSRRGIDSLSLSYHHKLHEITSVARRSGPKRKRGNMSGFKDAATVAGYTQNATRMVPGLHDLHRMTGVLLAEAAPPDARILVLGAGGGMELAALAQARPGWRFDGIDPSGPMLDLARQTVGPLMDRVRLHEGYIGDAPHAEFDGACCLLTLHFLAPEERLATLRELQRRLRPGARLVVAHHSFVAADADPDRWLLRNAGFAAASGMPAHLAENIPALRSHLPVLAPEQDAVLLAEAGFVDIELFYCAFSFKGWVARRAG